MNVKYYLHGDYDESELREYLTDQVGMDDSTLVKKLAESMHNFFYEVEFDVEFNEKGKITKVEMKKKL